MTFISDLCSDIFLTCYFRDCSGNASVAFFVSCFVASSDHGFDMFVALSEVIWDIGKDNGRTRRRIKEPWNQNASNDYREHMIGNCFAIVSPVFCVMGSCGN